MNKPRLLFMGTPSFAVYALEALFKEGYPIAAVVTQPDRPQGRGRLLLPSPVKETAQRLGLAVLQPERVRDQSFLADFSRLSPDICVVAAFGQIIPAAIINSCPCLNIHPSLLPKYRGAAPINWALIRGEEKTGVTIMQMDEGVDSGPIILQRETAIGEEETFGELHDRLASMGAELLLEALRDWQTGKIRPQGQDHALATLAPRLRKEDCLINWGTSGRQIVALVRGLSPAPCAHTFLKGRMLKVYRAKFLPARVEEDPGTVSAASPQGLIVAATDGYVDIKEVQLEGKRRLATADFLRGFPLERGIILGGDP